MTTEEMVANLKRFLSNPPQPIMLHDLVLGEVERVRGVMTSDPSYSSGHDLTGPEIADQLPRYEALSESLMALFAAGCRWSTSTDLQVWVDALERLSSLPVPPGARHIVPGHKINLHRYSALLCLYAGGIAAVAARRYDVFAALLTGGTVPDYYDHELPTDLPPLVGPRIMRVRRPLAAPPLP